MTWCVIVYISTFSRHETGLVLLIFALTAVLNLCNAYLRCELDYISIYTCHITKNIGIDLHTNTNAITAKLKDQKYITQNLLDRFQDSIYQLWNFIWSSFITTPKSCNICAHDRIRLFRAKFHKVLNEFVY